MLDQRKHAKLAVVKDESKIYGEIPPTKYMKP
jgi:hypothetical protein